MTSAGWRPEDGPRVRGEKRVAFVQQIAESGEGHVVEALRALLAAPEDTECGATLAALLGQIPTRTICLILSENHRHRFFSEADTESLFGAIPLPRLGAIAASLGGAAREILGAKAALSRVREAFDDQLRSLWERSPELVLRAAAELDLTILDRLLMLASVGRERNAANPSLQPILVGAARWLDNERLWRVLATLVQKQPAELRAALFEELLRLLPAERATEMVAERFEDDELRVYWVLFPTAMRSALAGMGRGPVWARPEHATHARRRRRAERTVRASSGRPYTTPRAEAHELESALQMMSGFGFRESMSYEDARRRYRQLAFAWHPDRAGSNPAIASRIRDLNYGWQVTRIHFAGAGG